MRSKLSHPMNNLRTPPSFQTPPNLIYFQSLVVLENRNIIDNYKNISKHQISQKILTTKLKDYALGYEFRSDGKAYNRELNTPVIETVEDLNEVIELVHKDLGHYGKRTTLDGVRERYEVASDLWEEGGKVLDSCIPCQLYMDAPEDKPPPIHPYGAQKPFALWEINFVGKLVKTPWGMEYLITTIEYSTSKAIAYPLEKRSAEAAIEMLEEIIWVYGKPSKIITDNGEEFRSKGFKAVAKRYGIEVKHTSPGHPQTNGKVERLNHELIQRLQRISAEEGNNRRDWNLYLRQALFAFHTHKNTRLGATPFFLQYGVEPVLPSTPVATSPITRVEIAEAAEHRKRHVQNLSKYRSDAAKKYQAALKRLVHSHKETSSPATPILVGDLVMRRPLNRKSKMHPKWEGPLIVIASSDTDVFQLATANGHILKKMTNRARLSTYTNEPDTSVNSGTPPNV
jgi:transposase InsO family protein